MLIVVDGPDGSGKTTICKKLQEILQNEDMAVEYKKLELCVQNLLLSNFIYELGTQTHILRQKPYYVYQQHYGNVLDGHKAPGPREKIFSTFMIIDKALTSVVLKHQSRNKILIVDAYLYDSLVPFFCRGLISKTLFNKMLSFRTIIRGNVEIFTDAHPEELYKRRLNDYGSIDSANCNRKYFLKVAEKMRSPVIYVDSPIDITINQVIVAILTQLLSHDKDRRLLHILCDSQQMKSVPKNYMRNLGFSLTTKPEDLLLHLLSNPYGNVDYETLEKFQFNRLNFEYLFSKAVKCRVGHTVLERMCNLSLSQQLEQRVFHCLSEKRKRYTVMLRHIATINDLFQKHDIDYVVFKTCRPYGEVTFDIDVVVSNYHDAVRILRSAGWVTELRHVLLKEVHLEKDGMTLDLHEQVRNIDRNLLLSTKRVVRLNDHCTTYVPRNDIELLTILTNCVADREVRLGDVHFIRSLVSQGKIDWKSFFSIVKPENRATMMSVLEIAKLKDWIFYDSSFQVYFPKVEKTKFGFNSLFKPIVPLSSRGRIKRRISHFMPISFLKQLIQSPKRTTAKTIEKLVDKDLILEA